MNNNILIGYGVNPPNLGGSNQLNIGNLLYSNNLGNSSTSATGGLGIGVTVPSARLDVSPTSAQIGARISGSSSTDMVRITQVGSGNTILVEDDSNPDSSPFVITSGGTIGIGTTTPNPFTANTSNGLFHVKRGNSGVPASLGTGGGTVIIESDTTNYLQMYAPMQI